MPARGRRDARARRRRGPARAGTSWPSRSRSRVSASSSAPPSAPDGLLGAIGRGARRCRGCASSWCATSTDAWLTNSASSAGMRGPPGAAVGLARASSRTSRRCTATALSPTARPLRPAHRRREHLCVEHAACSRDRRGHRADRGAPAGAWRRAVDRFVKRSRSSRCAAVPRAARHRGAGAAHRPAAAALAKPRTRLGRGDFSTSIPVTGTPRWRRSPARWTTCDAT